MNEQSFESQQTTFDANDLKATWDAENAAEKAIISPDESSEMHEHEEASAEEVTEESNEATPAEISDEESGETEKSLTKAEPIILRKQNKKMREQIRRLEGEMSYLRQQGTPNVETPTKSQGLVDPITGEPVDENSIEGQVFKAFNRIASAEQQKQAQQHARAQQQKQNEMMRSLYEKLDEASDKYADFDEVVRAEDVPITETMRAFATMLPNPAETFYALAKNKTELNNLAKSPPQEQVRKMVEISSRLLSKSNATVRKSPTKTITPLRNNPGNRQSSGAINDKSSVSDIRTRIKNGWK